MISLTASAPCMIKCVSLYASASLLVNSDWPTSLCCCGTQRFGSAACQPFPLPSNTDTMTRCFTRVPLFSSRYHPQGSVPAITALLVRFSACWEGASLAHHLCGPGLAVRLHFLPWLNCYSLPADPVQLWMLDSLMLNPVILLLLCLG